MSDYLRTLSYKVEEYVSTTPTTSLLFQIFSVAASLTGIILAFLRIANAPYIALAVLLPLNVFLLLINIRLFDGNERANDSLTKIVDVQRHSYKYISISDLTRIDPSGNAHFVRDLDVLALDQAAIHWMKVSMGVHNKTPAARFANLEFTAEDQAGVKLQSFLISDEPWKKQVIVFFNRPATSTKSYKFRFSYSWPGAYGPLVRKLTDYGYSTFKSDIDSYTLVVELPPNLKASGFSTFPQTEGITVAHNKFVWAPPYGTSGRIRFELTCLRPGK